MAVSHVFKILIYTFFEAVGASSVIPSYNKKEQIFNACVTIMPRVYMHSLA